MRASATLYVSVLSRTPHTPPFLGPAVEVHLSGNGTLTVFDDNDEPHTYAVEDIEHLSVLSR